MQCERHEIVDEIKRAFHGRRCWYASCGGRHVGATFGLAFGKRLLRAHVIQNDAHSEEFRRFEGEANLVVWCTWRLDNEDATITSSDDTEQGIVDGLQCLVGHEVVNTQVELPGWDLVLQFSGQLTLRIFCDHVPGNPSFDGNWQVSLQHQIFAFGPGIACDIEPRG